jgi:hypothetical protein
MRDHKNLASGADGLHLREKLFHVEMVDRCHLVLLEGHVAGRRRLSQVGGIIGQGGWDALVDDGAHWLFLSSLSGQITNCRLVGMCL